MNPPHFSCIFHVIKWLARPHMWMDFQLFKGLLSDDKAHRFLNSHSAASPTIPHNPACCLNPSHSAAGAKLLKDLRLSRHRNRLSSPHVGQRSTAVWFFVWSQSFDFKKASETRKGFDGVGRRLTSCSTRQLLLLLLLCASDAPRLPGLLPFLVNHVLSIQTFVFRFGSSFLQVVFAV